MKGHVTLTTDELHLIQAIIRKGPVFSGLEQFALSEGRIPGEIERRKKYFGRITAGFRSILPRDMLLQRLPTAQRTCRAVLSGMTIV